MAIVLTVYGLSITFSPFPLWRSYRVLWYHVLFDHKVPLLLKMRIQNALFLTRYLLLTPLWTGLWYLDEIFYGKYRSVVIDKVFVILGQPRCGTTFFQRTLAKDEKNILCVRHMEWRFPYICFHKLLKFIGLYESVARISYWPNTEAGRIASRMHEHYLGDVEEDGIFFEERFLHHYFIYRRFPYPELVKKLHEFDSMPQKFQSNMLRVHKKVLQKVIYMRGTSNQTLLLKENESMQIMKKFPSIYKDVKYIALVRDPRKSIRSYHALSKQSTLVKTGIDTEQIPQWEEANNWKRNKEFELQSEFLKENIPSKNFIGLSFEVFTEDLLDTILYLYLRLDLKMSSNYMDVLEDAEKHQKVRKRGYKLEEVRTDVTKDLSNFMSSIQNNHKQALVKKSGNKKAG